LGSGIISPESIRAETWTYQTMLLRQADRILEKVGTVIQRSVLDTQFNLMNVEMMIGALDVFTNADKKIVKPELSVKDLQGNCLTQKKYLEALQEWLREIIETFDQYGIKPYPTYEDGLEDEDGE